MAEELNATFFDKNKGNAGFSEVEELIRQTLEESKKFEKPAEAAPTPLSTPTPVPTPVAQPTPVVNEGKKEEFKATAVNLTPKPATPPVLRPEPLAGSPVPPKNVVKEPSTYEETFKEYKIGDIVRGKVLKVDPSGVLIDIKYKADGLILPEELSDRISGLPEELVKVGDIIEVLVENLENKEGYVVLSKKKADYEKKWKIASEAYRTRAVLEGKVLQALRGGLVVDCAGMRGFIPASQVSKKAEETFESLVGKILPVKVIEVNPRQGKIVLSHKMAAGEKGKIDAQKLIDELEVGQVRKGKVASLKNFGAFVDLGGIEGLIHLSEMSWKRIKHPSEMLKAGEEIDVFVLGVDRINKKIALGLKELQADPWVNAAELYKPGQVVKAKILRFAKFGAFAELEHGLEGLIHNTELSREPVRDPSEAAKIGDVVDVKILRVIPDEQKIGLSVREVLLDKERREIKAVAATQEVEEHKVTIGDMIAEKEKERAARAEEEEEVDSPDIPA